MEGNILFFDQIEVKFYYFRHDATQKNAGGGGEEEEEEEEWRATMCPQGIW